MATEHIPPHNHVRLARLKKEWFLIGMLTAVVLASFFPAWGKTGGVLHGDQVANLGIAIVFFLHGLGISPKNLRDGLARWRVHLFVQSSTFIIFPLLWALLSPVVSRWMPTGLALGFCYLCALPSTVSSSVAMTSIARGNVPAAIFNATISGIIGIVATPLLVSLFIGVAGSTGSITDAIFGIAKLLLLPLVIGHVVRPWLSDWAQKNKRYVNLLDRSVILMLVYTAFCDSVASGLWQNNALEVIFMAIVGVAIFLSLILTITTLMARRLSFTKSDEITAVFCGSKKTLASGVPMAKLLFGTHPSLGLILLPIMFYHQLQLLVCSMLATRYAKRTAD